MPAIPVPTTTTSAVTVFLISPAGIGAGGISYGNLPSMQEAAGSVAARSGVEAAAMPALPAATVPFRNPHRPAWMVESGFEGPRLLEFQHCRS